MQGKNRHFKIDSWIFYILPSLIFYTFFLALPLVSSLGASFFTDSGGGMHFAGLENYRRIFFDPEISQRYFGAFRNTIIFFLFHMVIQNILGLFFANILITPHLRAVTVYRTLIFLPVTLSIIVTGFLWQLILNPQWGGFNQILMSLGILDKPFPWLGDSRTALVAVSLVSCWQWVGLPTMMFTAGLQTIPPELYEAAEMEGANWMQVLMRIRIPLLMPVIGIVTILTFVNNFNAFDVVFAMENANGAPQFATDIMGTLFYRIGIAGQHPVGIPDQGLGATIATLTVLFLGLGIGLFSVIFRSRASR